MDLNAFDLFPEITESEPTESDAWRANSFRDLQRGDIIHLGSQAYEVVRTWDNYHLSVRKPGAKRKTFTLRHNGPTISVYVEKGSFDETYKYSPVSECSYLEFKRT